MKLYYHPISGHSHRARTFLSMIGAEVELVEVNLAAGAHKSPEYLAINPLGQVPVLEDEGTFIPDSNAILVYAAKKAGRSDWLPEEPAAAAAVQRWLSIAAGQIAYGPAAARLINLFRAPFQPTEVIQRGQQILSVINAELEGKSWIIGGSHPTIADVALYSYIARAPEGNISLEPYVQLRVWLKRVEALPGFVPFQQTPVGLSAA